MNDRHRTIERWKKKQAANNKYINEMLLTDSGTTMVKALTNLVVKLAGAMNIFVDEFKRMCSTIIDFLKEINAMPEDEFQKKLEELRPQLTDEQIMLLYKIRGDGNNDKPNNKA